MANVLIRKEIADYFDLGTADIPDIQFAGPGFNTLDENPSAQTETKAYINDASASTSVIGYQPEFPFDCDLTEEDPIINVFYDTGTRRKVGGKAVLTYYRVELWRNIEESENTFKARKMDVAVVVENIAGAGAQVVHVTGKLQGIGDPIDGAFNTVTKTFTEAGAENTEG